MDSRKAAATLITDYEYLLLEYYLAKSPCACACASARLLMLWLHMLWRPNTSYWRTGFSTDGVPRGDGGYVRAAVHSTQRSHLR